MASYKSKLISRMTETQSGRIAFSLSLLDEYWIRKDWIEDLYSDKGVQIDDDIFVYRDGSYGFYYTIVKYNSLTPNRYAYKVVHQYLDYDELVEMLDAQKWQYI